MGSIIKIMNSEYGGHTSDHLSKFQLQNISEQAKIHGKHKPYANDFGKIMNDLRSNK